MSQDLLSCRVVFDSVATHEANPLRYSRPRWCGAAPNRQSERRYIVAHDNQRKKVRRQFHLTSENMRRLTRATCFAVIIAILLGITSYLHARSIANKLWGPLRAEELQFHDGVIPLRRFPTGSWGWVIGYGSQLHDAHAEIYVSPFGRLIGTNPIGLQRDLMAWQRRPPAT